VLDTINGQDCTRSDAGWLFTYNSGKYVEGLTALYQVTKDSSLMTEYVGALAALSACSRAAQGDERRGRGHEERAVAGRERRDHRGRVAEQQQRRRVLQV
jgi:hypothetical protein